MGAYENYLDGLEREQNRQKVLETSLGEAANTNPDEFAKMTQLSRAAAVAVEAVPQYEDIAKSAKLFGEAGIGSMWQDNPQAARFLVDPNKAKIASDDIANMKATENQFTELGKPKPTVIEKSFWEKTGDVISNIGSAAGSAIPKASSGLYGVGMAGADLLAPILDPVTGYDAPVKVQGRPLLYSNPIRDFSNYLSGYQQLFEKKAKEEMPKAEGALESGFYSGIASLTQNVASLPLLMLGPGGQQAYLTTMTAPVFGESYAEAKEKGVPLLPALTYATSQALVEYATEKLPINRLIGDVKAGSTFMQTVGKQLALEIPGEQAATILQDFNEWMVLHPEKTLKDYVDARPGAAAQTLVATIVGVGGQTAIVQGASTVAQKLEQRAIDADTADRVGKTIDTLTELSNAAKVRTRDAETFREWIDQVSEDSPVQNVYISAETLRQSGHAEELIKASPTIAAQYEAALQGGTDIQIPVAEYMTDVAPTSAAKNIIDDLRVEGETMTRREAQQFIDTKTEELAAAAESESSERAKNAEFIQSARQVEDNMLQQIKATGVYSPAASRSFATYVRDIYVAKAAEMGMTPSQLFEAIPYTVTSERQAPIAELFNQQGEVDLQNPLFKEFFGKSVLKDETGTPIVVYHGTKDSVTYFDLNHPNRKDTGWLGNGVYMTDSKPLANLYSMVKGGAGKPQVMELYARLENPYYATQEEKEQMRFGGVEMRDKFTADRIAEGHDGVILENKDGTREIVVFDPTSVKSKQNSGTWSRETDLIFAQRAKEQEEGRAVPETLDALSNVASTFSFAATKKFANNREFKLAIQKRVQEAAKAAKIDLNEFTKNVEKYLVRVAMADAYTALETNPNAVGWYNEKVTKALRLAALIHPEIATDRQAKFAFTWALAVTSNGLKVNKNFELAEQAYRYYKENGKMPTDMQAGQAQAAINKSLDLYNTLIAEHGFERVEEFMTTKTTVKEVEAFTGTNVSGENKTTMVYGAAALGPKIGNGFFANLYGHFEQLTMDRWLMRTWGRWTATLIKEDKANVKLKQDQLKKLIKAMPADQKKAFEAIIKTKLVVGKVDEIAKAITKASTSKENRVLMAEIGAADDAIKAIFTEILGPPVKGVERASMGDEMRKLGNALSKYLDGQKEQPSGPPERGRIRQVMAQALTNLQREYPSLTMSDLQALLWYPEKRLYDAAKTSDEAAQTGYEDDEAPDYANAAADLARSLGVSEDLIKKTIEEVDNELRTQAGNGTGSAERDTGDGVLRQNAVRKEEGTVIFEVAPDPNNVELTNAWNALGADQRNEISEAIAAQIVPAVLQAAGATGAMTNQVGSYLDNTNPSFAVKLTSGNPMEVAKALGFVLSQDSMMVVAPAAFEGSFQTGAIQIQVGEKTEAEIDQIYQVLRGAEGVPQIQGQTTTNGAMTILLDESMDAQAMADAFDKALGEEFNILVHEVSAAFPEKQEYDYASSESDPAGDSGLARQRYRDARSEAGRLLDEAISAGSSTADQGSRQGNAEDLAARSRREAAQRAGQFAQPARGGFDPKKLTTILTEQADYSTFLHETAHFYLTAMFQMAQMPQATQQMRDDVQTVLDWFNVKDLETWNKLSLDEQRKHHEAWAYNHEIYVFEGKAPSIQLQTLFDKFSSWLRRVYKSIRDDLNVIYKAENGTDLPILTGEVRQVMDRMLASEEEIKRASMVRDMVPIYQNQAQSGMNDQEWAAYQEMAKEAQDAATAEMTTASLRQMKWLSNARSRILKAMQRETAEIRKDVRANVAVEVANQPVYRADRFIRRGEMDLAETANQEQRRFATEAGLKGTKLSLEALKEMYGEGPAAPWRYMPTGQYGLVATEGLHPDVVADQFGFSSGDEMIREILAAPPMKEAIDQLTDQRVLEEHGDLSDPKAMQNAVEQALHNEARARFVAVELRHAAKATQPARLMIEAARRAAARIIGGKKVRDVKASEYSIEEARATKRAELAMKEGRSADVTKALQGRLLNNQLARMAANAVSEIDAGLRYLKSVQTDASRKRIGADYSDQIDGILERFDLAKRSFKEIDRRTTLSAFLNKQREAGIAPEISPEIEEGVSRKNYKNMTVDEFRDLVDAVKQIAHMGRTEQMLLTAAKETAYKDARDQIVASININARGRKANARTPTTNTGRWLQNMKKFYAAHIKAASIARILDGGQEGPMWEYFIRTANDRADQETAERAKATETLAKIMAPIFKNGKMGGSGIYFDSIKRSLNKESRIAIALNMGNAGNIQRLLGGENWTIDQVAPILQSLTQAELNAVQKIWDHFESYRPKIAAKERKLYGKEPKWVEPQPLVVVSSDGKTVTLQGGYYPIKYDPQATEVAESHNEAEEAKRQLQGAYTSATTRRSFTKARVEEVTGRPLLYTLAGMYSGVNDVIHDLAWHEWLIDANKLLRSTAIDEAIRNQYGPEFKQQLKTWVQDVAAGERGVQNEGEIALNFLRQSVSMAGLGFNVMSALQQVTGFSSSMIRLGPAYMGRGIAKMITSPILAANEANEKSVFMANRARTQFRELNELRNLVQDENPGMRAIRVGAYFMMARMQKMVDVPTWHGAYEKAISQGNDEQRAIALADQAVIDTQGGGMMKDLSRIERGGAALKLFTVFYSYMNTQFNLAVTEGMTEKSKGRLFAKMLLLTVVPVVMTYAIKKGMTPSDDDDWDWEKISKDLAAEGLSYLMGMMVIAREFGEAGKIIVGAEGPGRTYGGPAGTRMIGDVLKFAQQAGQGELDEAFRKAAVNLLGDFTGLPSAQINRTINGVEALIEGDTKNPAAAVLGFEKAR